VLEVRTVLEVEAGRLALARLSSHDIRRLAQQLAHAQTKLEQRRLREYLQHSRAFHVAMSRIGRVPAARSVRTPWPRQRPMVTRC
jgi:DNA-binding GntR family transcriptional regulator